MSIGWTTLTDANSFFATHIAGERVWTGLTDAQKTTGLTTAYQRILYSRQLSIPSSPTGEILSRLQYAQHLMTVFVLIAGADIYARLSAISSGVTSAGVVQESYGKANQLPDDVLEALQMLRKDNKSMAVIDLYRKEKDNKAWDKAYPGSWC